MIPAGLVHSLFTCSLFLSMLRCRCMANAKFICFNFRRIEDTLMRRSAVRCRGCMREMCRMSPFELALCFLHFSCFQAHHICMKHRKHFESLRGMRHRFSASPPAENAMAPNKMPSGQTKCLNSVVAFPFNNNVYFSSDVCF